MAEMFVEVEFKADKTREQGKRVVSVANEMEQGFRRAISALDLYENKLHSIIALHNKIKPPPFTSPRNLPTGLPTDRGAINTSKILDKLDNQLAKLQNRDSELRRINKILAQPDAAEGIDSSTQALLRQNAALVDAEKKTRSLERARARELSAGDQSNSGAGLIATAIVGSAAVAGVYALIKSGAEYEKAMDVFQAVTKASAAEMKRAQQVAVALGNDLTLPGISAKDAGDAMKELGKANFTAAQAIEGARGVLLLSTAANISAAQAAEITANAINAFGLKAKDAARVADLLAAAASSASGEVTDIAMGMQQAAMVFNAANQSIETLTTGIALLANAGVKGSDAGTSLKTMMLKIINPTNEATAVMKQFGIEFYDVATGKMKPLRDIAEILNQKLGQLTEQQRNQALATIFQSDAIRPAIELMKQGGAGFDKMSAAVQRSNAAQELAAAQTKGLAGAWGALTSQAETLGLTIYNGIKTPLTETVIFIAKFIGLIGDYPAAFGAAILVVGALTAAHVLYNSQLVMTASSAIPAMVRSVINSIAVMGQMTSALLTGSTAMSAFSTTAMVSFVTGWGLVAAAVAVALYGLYSYNQAQVKTADEHLRGIEALKGQSDAVNNQKQALISAQEQTRHMGDESAILTLKNKDLASIYDALDVKSKNRVDDLVQERGAVGALADEIERLNRSKLNEVQSRLTDLIKNAATAYNEMQKAKQASDAADAAYTNALRNKPLPTVDAKTGAEIVSTTQKFEEFRKVQQNTGDAFRASEKTFNDYKSTVSAGISVFNNLNGNTKTTIDQFITQKNTLGELDITNKDFISTLGQAGSAQITAANKTDQATGAIDAQTNAVKSLRDQFKGLVSDMQVRVDDKAADLAMFAYKKGLNKAQVADMARSMQKYDPELLKDVKGIKTLNEFDKVLKDTWQPPEKSSSSRKISDRNPITERLPASGEGYTTYRREKNQQFGKQESIVNIETLARNWAQVSNKLMDIGDLSARGGVGTKDHDGHKGGDTFDMRPFGLNGKWNPGETWKSKNYDRDATRAWLEVLKETMPSARVLFNDPVLIKEGLVRPYAGHDNHLDIKMRGQARAGDDFAERRAENAQRKRRQDSSDATEAETRARAQNAIIALNTTGRFSDPEAMQDVVKVMQENARNSGLAVPRSIDVERGLQAMAAKTNPDAGGINYVEPARDINDIIRERLNLDDRQGQYLLRNLHLEKETAARQEDYLLSLEETVQEMGFEANLLGMRNLGLETSVKIEREVLDLKRAQQDLGIEIDVFRRMNSDAQIVEQRRFLAAKREEFGLEQDISDLQDRIANSGINDALLIEKAHLEDILELRSRETDAVIATNRAQTQMSSSMEISNNQIRAGIYSHLAEANSINESIAGGFNKTFDAVSDKWTATLDKLDQKTKGFLSFVIEPAKAIQKGILTNFATGMIDRIFPPEIADMINSGGNKELSEAKTQTRLLERIADNTSQGVGGVTGGGSITVNQIVDLGRSVMGGGGNRGRIGGGGFFSLIGGIGSLLGIGSGSSSNRSGISGGTPPFVASPSGNRFTQTLDMLTSTFQRQQIETPVPVTASGGGGGATGGMWGGYGGINKTRSGLESLLGGKFSLNKSLFGEKGFGWNAGTISGIGGMASLAGGLLGNGRIGSSLSGFGTGVGMASSLSSILGISALGGPVGLLVGGAIGGVVGLISSIFGSNKQKKQDRQTYNAAVTDVYGQIDKLIMDVHADRTDGQSAIAQANGLREQFVSQMGQLKDKTARKEAMAKTAGIDSRISSLRQAVTAQDARQDTASKWQGYATGGLVQTFADGGTAAASPAFAEKLGYNRFNSSLPRNFSGHIPGSFDRKDDVHLAVSRGERVIVMTPEQWDSAGEHITPHLQQAKVPGFYTGGGYNIPEAEGSSSSNGGSHNDAPDKLEIELIIPEGWGFKLLSKILKTRAGRLLLVNAFSKESERS